jgi:hypothetical protein
MDEFERVVRLKFRWGWQVAWMGWPRCLWLSVAIDLRTPFVGVVFFGLMVTYGKNKLVVTEAFTN